MVARDAPQPPNRRSGNPPRRGREGGVHTIWSSCGRRGGAAHARAQSVRPPKLTLAVLPPKVSEGQSCREGENMSDEPGLFEVMYSSRAMRRLKPDPVPEDILLKLVDAGNQGPTGSNMQNVRWLIVRDAGQKRKLADLNRTAVTAYMNQAPSLTWPLPRRLSANGCATRWSFRWSTCTKCRH